MALPDRGSVRVTDRGIAVRQPGVDWERLFAPTETPGIFKELDLAVPAGMAAPAAMSMGPSMTTSAMQAPTMMKSMTTSQMVRDTFRPLDPMVLPRITARIQEAIQRIADLDDGELIFTVTFDDGCGYRVGGEWENEFESPFWIGSEFHLMDTVNEWVNSEFESVMDRFYYEEGGIDIDEEHKLHASLDTLQDAWETVAAGEPFVTVTATITDQGGFPIEVVSMTAGDLMGYWGLDGPLWPTVVIADQVLTEDYDAISGDDHAYLAHGYQITSVDRESEDFTIIHIKPTTN